MELDVRDRMGAGGTYVMIGVEVEGRGGKEGWRVEGGREVWSRRVWEVEGGNRVHS